MHFVCDYLSFVAISYFHSQHHRWATRTDKPGMNYALMNKLKKLETIIFHLGREFTWFSQGIMQSVWKQCLQGICFNSSSILNSSLHTAHSTIPSSAVDFVIFIVGSFSIIFFDAGGGPYLLQTIIVESTQIIYLGSVSIICCKILSKEVSGSSNIPLS